MVEKTQEQIGDELRRDWDNELAAKTIEEALEEKTVYADVGDKLNYVAYWQYEDGGLEFQAWIRKYCVKDGDEMVDPKTRLIKRR